MSPSILVGVQFHTVNSLTINYKFNLEGQVRLQCCVYNCIGLAVKMCVRGKVVVYVNWIEFLNDWSYVIPCNNQ